MERRVVITGMGVVSPIGNDLDTFWNSLIAGKSGIGHITNEALAEFDCQIAGEVRDFDAAQYFKNPKDARRADRFAQLAMGAAVMAMDDSGIDLEQVDLDRFGCMVGSGIGGLETLEGQHINLTQTRQTAFAASSPANLHLHLHPYSTFIP